MHINSTGSLLATVVGHEEASVCRTGKLTGTVAVTGTGCSTIGDGQIACALNGIEPVILICNCTVCSHGLAVQAKHHMTGRNNRCSNFHIPGQVVVAVCGRQINFICFITPGFPGSGSIAMLADVSSIGMYRSILQYQLVFLHANLQCSIISSKVALNSLGIGQHIGQYVALDTCNTDLCSSSQAVDGDLVAIEHHVTVGVAFNLGVALNCKHLAGVQEADSAVSAGRSVILNDRAIQCQRTAHRNSACAGNTGIAGNGGVLNSHHAGSAGSADSSADCIGAIVGEGTAFYLNTGIVAEAQCSAGAVGGYVAVKGRVDHLNSYRRSCSLAACVVERTAIACSVLVEYCVFDINVVCAGIAVDNACALAGSFILSKTAAINVQLTAGALNGENRAGLSANVLLEDAVIHSDCTGRLLATVVGHEETIVCCSGKLTGTVAVAGTGCIAIHNSQAACVLNGIEPVILGRNCTACSHSLAVQAKNHMAGADYCSSNFHIPGQVVVAVCGRQINFICFITPGFPGSGSLSLCLACCDTMFTNVFCIVMSSQSFVLGVLICRTCEYSCRQHAHNHNHS